MILGNVLADLFCVIAPSTTQGDLFKTNILTAPKRLIGYLCV